MDTFGVNYTGLSGQGSNTRILAQNGAISTKTAGLCDVTWRMVEINLYQKRDTLATHVTLLVEIRIHKNSVILPSSTVPENFRCQSTGRGGWG